MLSINIVCVGKLKEEYLRQAQAEYSKRLSTFCKLNVIEVESAAFPESPTKIQIDAGMTKEATAILAQAKGYIIPLCIEGEMLDSPALSKKFDTLALDRKSTITFVIGGSYGLSDKVKSKGHYKLSMSKMTFPHQLARVMLLEQVYRSFQISSHGKYHK